MADERLAAIREVAADPDFARLGPKDVLYLLARIEALESDKRDLEAALENRLDACNESLAQLRQSYDKKVEALEQENVQLRREAAGYERFMKRVQERSDG